VGVRVVRLGEEHPRGHACRAKALGPLCGNRTRRGAGVASWSPPGGWGRRTNVRLAGGDRRLHLLPKHGVVAEAVRVSASTWPEGCRRAHCSEPHRAFTPPHPPRAGVQPSS
jgi:hypothetical protein